MSAHRTRARLLIQQSRYDMAEKELRQHLASAPEDASAHALLAVCLINQQREGEAIDEVHEAIRLAPDAAFVHYVHACVLNDVHKPKDARAAVQEAIRLEPDNADYFALLANIELQLKNWQAALSAAEQGLKQDAQHADCNNGRAIALTQLGRRDEAGINIQEQLARNPNDAVTHANMGWTLLHQSQPRQAAEHFREALRLEPDNEWARRGVIEAIKARNLVYRLMLRYFLWLGRQKPAVQYGLIIGLLLAVNMLSRLKASHPTLAPWITAVVFAYGVFVVMSWTSVPLFNLLLRLDRFGRHALSPREIAGANWLGAWLGVIAAMFIASIALYGYDGLLMGGAWGLLILPAAAAYSGDAKANVPMLVATLILAAMAVASLVMLAYPMNSTSGQMSLTLLRWFMWGCVISTWIAPVLAARR